MEAKCVYLHFHLGHKSLHLPTASWVVWAVAPATCHATTKPLNFLLKCLFHHFNYCWTTHSFSKYLFSVLNVSHIYKQWKYKSHPQGAHIHGGYGVADNQHSVYTILGVLSIVKKRSRIYLNSSKG